MKKKFSWRAFISFGLTYAFAIILISGVVLYIAPPGRYANWVNWEIAGMTKLGWQSLHTLFSFVFVILSIFHLFTINWKTFLSYLKSKTQNGLNKKREFILSTTLVLVFLFGILFSVPPFQSIMDLSEYLTNSWEKQDKEPPVPHAELLTLTELAEKMNLSSVDELTKKLDKNNIRFNDPDSETLGKIAEMNQSTPLKIYELIHEKPASQQQGQGIGRKTLDDFATEVGKTTDEVIQILKENHIEAGKNQTLRQIADQNNITPKTIYELFQMEN